MGLFKKNPNEVNYTEGKKHFTDVIKNTGPGELLIWKQPEEDFNTNSTLIVMPGEAAIFVKGGTIEQVFDNGTYKLSTENYPFISRIRNILTGGISTFNCVVYFVKKSHSIEIKWGTDSPIQVRDKVLGISTKLRCRGTYKVAIDNPAKFLEKLVGGNNNFELQCGLDRYFISEFQSKIKSVIARGVNESNTELLGIDARLDEFSEMIEPYMQETLDAYGLRCVKFVVSAIDIDDNELRQKYDQIGMQAYETRAMASAASDASRMEAAARIDAKKYEMDSLGDNWAKQQSAEILRDLANNPNAGGIGAMGAGMGMGMAAGTIFGGMASQMFEPMANLNQQSSQQPTSAPTGRFMQQSAESAPTPTPAPVVDDPVESLGKLKRLLDAGLIDQSEYDAKKAEILSRL